MKKIYSSLVSTQFTAVLMVIFSVAMAVATFVENDFGTPAARKLIFDATWFEVVMVLLAVNFVGNIKRYQLWQKAKLPILMFHISLIVIIIGAGISRLIAFEGIMHIREGKASNTIVTDKTYLQVFFKAKTPTFEKELLLTPITRNDFSSSFEINNKDYDIDYVSYIPHAIQVYEEADNGHNVIHLVASAGRNGRTDFYIREGDITDVFGTSISYNLSGMGDLQIYNKEGEFYINPHHEISFMKMADQSRGIAKQDTLNQFHQAALYMHDNMSFVFKEALENAALRIVPSEKEEDKNKEDVLVVNITSGEESQEVVLFGMRGLISPKREIIINGEKLLVRYGSKELYTPFHIELKDFQLERYPGSQSPASFASEVVVRDKETSFPFRVFMNNVLDYRGYRFFQSSYDSDEKGTVLSVNHDFIGTMITYFGYLLMTVGMMMTLFWKGSRFKQLAKGISRSKNVVASVVLLLGFVSIAAAQHGAIPEVDADSLLANQKIRVEHANQFGNLLVQDEGGRIKPLNTVASEVLRKLNKNNTFEGLSANQVLLGMHADPMSWSFIPIIRITKGKHNIEHLLHVEGKYARYIDFFGAEGNYVLAEATEDVMQKREADRNEVDKLLLEISQRVTLMYEVFNGKLFRIFPLPNDPNNKWYSYTDVDAGFTNEDSLFVYNIPYIYFKEVKEAMHSGEWESATEKLVYFDKYQQRFGEAVLPSLNRVKLEVLYNKIEIFNQLYKYYGLVGLLMLIFLLINIFKDNKVLKAMIIVFSGLIVLQFLFHTLGLGVRWYISGHAPWSNAYESMVYVAWSTVLAGILFIKRSKITLAATAIMASIFLMVAHWNWMNPEIGNLVPVLNSYWLMIHVAIIVASYGPFTLGFLLGIICLILNVLQTESNYKELNIQISRLAKINEMILTIGIFLLAIGTFLGGVWANESWGRYWSWDPKETWALISVMVYAFVLHMRIIPGLKSTFSFNIAAVAAYASIMMTYFGVNFYLAGMHSYAKGDPVPVPSFIYYIVGSLALLAFLAYWRNKQASVR